MKIAVIGGTGFIGSHLTGALVNAGHFPAVIARGLNRNTESLRKLPNLQMMMISIDDERKLFQTINNCDAVIHLAGSSKEQKPGHFKALHVDSTLKIVHAARKAMVNKIVYISYLHASEKGKTNFHKTKAEAEKIIRESSINYTILRPSIVFGPGDHLLSGISRSLSTSPMFATVGLFQRTLRPVSVKDLLRVINAAALDDRLANMTCSVMGPEELTLGTLVGRVSRVTGKPAIAIPVPVLAHAFMTSPSGEGSSMFSSAMVSMLAEGMSKSPADCNETPKDLAPVIAPSEDEIREALGL